MIVVDDGSTDNTKKVIEGWIQAHSSDQQFTTYYLRQENRGAPVARNHGLQEARGKYVKFLDSDDKLLSEAVSQQVEFRNRLVPASHGGYAVFGDMQAVKSEWPEPKIKEYTPPPETSSTLDFLSSNHVYTPLPLYERKILTKVKGFDETLPFGQELDLHVRLALSGVQFKYCPGIVVSTSNDGHERISNQYDKWSADRDYLWLYKQILNRIKEAGALGESVRKAWAEKLWRHGRQAVRKGYDERSRAYFDRSRQLHRKGMVGSAVYRSLCKLLGPVYTERVLERVKQFTRRAS